MKKKIVCAIIVLCLILILQSYNIYKKTYHGYMFDYRYDAEKVNIDYVVLSYNLLAIKNLVPLNEETVLSVFINNYDNKYNIPLQYWFNKRNFYPITMPREHNTLAITDYTNDKFKYVIEKKENDYVVIVGKNSTILNVTTTKDITLFKVNENLELELMYEYDNNLYNLREHSKKYQDQYFNETIKYINDYIDNYSNFYGISAYNYIYEYAIDLSENSEDVEAMIYYDKYLRMSSLDSDILLNKADIYNRIGDYENTLLMIDACKQQDDCNIELANKIEDSVVEIK